MIIYHSGGVYHVLNLFRMEGSIFPRTLPQSLFCGLLAGLVKYCLLEDFMGWNMESPKFIMSDTVAWGGFTSLVGFLVVFRTSMAYNRFWEGATMLYRMRAEWMDACSSIFAFSHHGRPADTEEMTAFRDLLVRLFSMLHSLALAEIEDCSSKMPEDVRAFRYELIDPGSIDCASLRAIKNSNGKVELVFQWIQQLVTENIHYPGVHTGLLTIPPPILSRAYQELATGMVAFQEAVKVSSVPFPFPYAQCCDCLLLIHWCVTPIVVSQWFLTPWWAGAFAFFQVFTLQVLNCIAVEIENPFGSDANDINCDALQDEMNVYLLQLQAPTCEKTPHLVIQRKTCVNGVLQVQRNLLDAWADLEVSGGCYVDVMRSRGAVIQAGLKRSASTAWRIPSGEDEEEEDQEAIGSGARRRHSLTSVGTSSTSAAQPCERTLRVQYTEQQQRTHAAARNGTGTPHRMWGRGQSFLGDQPSDNNVRRSASLASMASLGLTSDAGSVNRTKSEIAAIEEDPSATSEDVFSHHGETDYRERTHVVV